MDNIHSTYTVQFLFSEARLFKVPFLPGQRLEELFCVLNWRKVFGSFAA